MALLRLVVAEPHLAHAASLSPSMFLANVSCPSITRLSLQFLPLRNRGLGPLAVTVLPIPLAMRAAATVCSAPRGKMVSGKEATGIPGTSRSRLGKLARTARALFTAALQSPVQVRGPALNAGSGGHANPG